MLTFNPKKISDDEIIFYQSPNGSMQIEVMFAKDNLWLPQKKIAELFEVERSVVTKHLLNIFKEREIDIKSNVQKMHNALSDKPVNYYSLEAIIAVGYRINSVRGTEFRQWATEVLKSYIYKGYAIDDNRMKYGSRFSARYFDELYEIIKDIRTSERRIYQKITDIYATSIDYSPNALVTKDFFATVQNKMHFAITGQTAAEIISKRVSSRKDKMGLTSWRSSPNGKIMPSDVVIAKNYLNRKELGQLNRVGNMYLDYAEMQAARGRAMTMKDWIEKLNAFLKFSEYDILNNLGKVSHKVAEELALGEYEKYRIKQDKNYISDFDREVNKLIKGSENTV